ncbi:serine hydrolase domain-containing protein [Bergeyella zoohelcum]|uniref:serine hydrolase domain-containing protein n=1 Tax=Bergeyella zoohelcum TaxID=1015 RepID=UPI0037352B67
MNSSTVFELASVSKQFTAMDIVLLEKQKKLKYDDKISRYIPELAFYGNITIQNLLHHTSGLPDYMELFEEKWDKTEFAVNQDIVNELAKYQPKLHFLPGEKYEYSNTGYALLGLIIEKVSKKSFGQFLSEHY